MIKHLDKSTVKQKEKDVIWILKNLNTVSTCIDYLGNKHVNYLNALKYFVNKRQGNLEGDNSHTNQSRLAIYNLIMYGGCHVW